MASRYGSTYPSSLGHLITDSHTCITANASDALDILSTACFLDGFRPVR
jgi:hypothetical protein